MRATVQREAGVLQMLAGSLVESCDAAVDLLLHTRGHVLVGGAGTSNAIARRFAHLLSCSGLPALFIHPSDSLHGSSGAVRREDTVVLISKGGKTREVNDFAALCKQRGADLIAITESPESPLAKVADALICVRVEEGSDPFGLVATASSLANAAICDAICETVLYETGYTLRDFASTHPGGAVGERIRRDKVLP